LKFILTLLSVFSFLFAAAQSTASKNVSTFTLEAPQLHCSKKIWLYLPENYSKSDKKYPVIYMHDGQNLMDVMTSYAGEWSVDETLDSLKAQVIVIGIEHGGEKRMEELTPYEIYCRNFKTLCR
jgi:predicted alpha/beta superfamily hydrolase